MTELVAHCTQYPFCVFVVYDDEDDWTRKELLHLLDENSIRCCYLEKDSNPGQLFSENFQSLLERSRKVLFVVSAEFCRNRQAQHMAAMALYTHALDRIITLITDGDMSHKNVLLSLRYTKNIQKDSDEWKDRLIKEIKFEIPKFCQLLSTDQVSDLLFHRGLCLMNFRSELFGLSLVTGEKCYRVDLEEFSKHLNFHEKYQTIEACGQCRFLYNVDSRVSMIINSDVPLNENADRLVEAFGRLCQYVCDLSSLRPTFAPLCTVSGPFQPNQQKFATELFEEVFDAFAFEYIKRLVEPWVPKYVDLDKRIESFQGVWQQETSPPAEQMAKAGFYFLERPDLAQCFFCGFNRSPWEKDDDPVLVHEMNAPTCSFHRQNLPKTDMSHKKVRRYFAPIEKFKSHSARKQSLDHFDVGKYCPDRVHGDKNEDIICRLAECGFFYKGADAEMMCFSCGLRIFYISCKIHPWVLHADLSSSCPYLRSIKGDSFVQTVIESKLRANEPTIVHFFLKKYDGSHRLEIPNLFKPCRRLKVTEL